MNNLDSVTKLIVRIGLLLTLQSGFSIGLCVGATCPDGDLTNTTALVLITGAVALGWFGFQIINTITK